MCSITDGAGLFVTNFPAPYEELLWLEVKLRCLQPSERGVSPELISLPEAKGVPRTPGVRCGTCVLTLVSAIRNGAHHFVPHTRHKKCPR